MIVMTFRYGQLGNRLTLFAHFMANAITHGYVVCNPAFSEYAQYFRGTCRNTLCKFPNRFWWVPVPAALCRRLDQLLLKFLNRVVSKRLRRGVAILDIAETDEKGDVCDLSGERFISARNVSRVLLVHGWLFRDVEGFRRHAGAIRDFFTPVEPYAANVVDFIAKARVGTDLLVGIHVRLGDYAEFLGGRYYYAHGDYLRIMQEIGTLFPGRRVRFVVCSNEAASVEKFETVDVLSGPGHELEDLYVLSLCDYLAGPPSTYTNWASYYGGVPLFKIMSKDVSVSLGEFRVYNG